MDIAISFASTLISIHDPRIDRAKKHNHADIVIITLCATICGMEGWEEIEVFAEELEDWFRGFLELPMSELIRLLELKKAIVTIDAIGCQKEITRILREESKADYVLALKKNQPNLHNEVVHFFKVAEKSDDFVSDFFESVEKGHGRIEQRQCTCLSVADNLDHVAAGFHDLRTIAKIHATREINGKIEEQTRYFISSLPCDARQIAHAIRTHWSIENSLHWRLDVVFKEDDSRIRKDHAPENLAIIRRIALGLVKDRLPANSSQKNTHQIYKNTLVMIFTN